MKLILSIFFVFFTFLLVAAPLVGFWFGQKKYAHVPKKTTEKGESSVRVLQAQTENNIDNKELGREIISPWPTSNKKQKQCVWDDMIIIEKIGVRAPIIWSKSREEEDLQKDMRHGVIHYPGTTMPGQRGNIFIAGHSTYYSSDPGKYKNIFIRLGELKKEEKIKIIIGCEEEYEYEIFQIEPVEPDDQRIFDMKNKDGCTLTLATCWPIGSYKKRLMIKARQIGTCE